MNTISIKLKELRKEKNLTQKELAKILDISTTCYAGYEQGYREPDIKTLKKLCIILDVSADFLIGLEDDAGVKIYGNNYNNFGIHKGDVNF